MAPANALALRDPPAFVFSQWSAALSASIVGIEPLQRSASGHLGLVLRQQPGQLTQSHIAALAFGWLELEIHLTLGSSHICGLRVRPNPSFKLRPNGKSPSPAWRYAVHFRQSGLGASPSVPAYLER